MPRLQTPFPIYAYRAHSLRPPPPRTVVQLQVDHFQLAIFQIQYCAGIGRASSGRAGIDTSGAPFCIVVHLVTMTGEYQIVFPTSNRLVEKTPVVTMEQGDSVISAYNIPEPPVKLHPNIGRKEFPIARMNVDVPENRMNRFHRAGQFGQDIHSANITAVEYRRHAGLAKDRRSLRCRRNVSMGIGKNSYFHGRKIACSKLVKKPKTED